jgi:hypothetical protein
MKTSFAIALSVALALLASQALAATEQHDHGHDHSGEHSCELDWKKVQWSRVKQECGEDPGHFEATPIGRLPARLALHDNMHISATRNISATCMSRRTTSAVAEHFLRAAVSWIWFLSKHMVFLLLYSDIMGQYACI